MQGLLICIKVIMLPSIFEKHKMRLNRTKSPLMVDPTLSAILCGFCDVTAFCHLTLPFFLQFYKPRKTTLKSSNSSHFDTLSLVNYNSFE